MVSGTDSAARNTSVHRMCHLLKLEHCAYEGFENGRRDLGFEMLPLAPSVGRRCDLLAPGTVLDGVKNRRALSLVLLHHKIFIRLMFA